MILTIADLLDVPYECQGKSIREWSQHLEIQDLREASPARHELSGLEWLGEVVVGSQFQSHDSVGYLASGRKHDDGDGLLLADLPAELEAVHVRKHDLEYDQIRGLRVQLPQAISGMRS